MEMKDANCDYTRERLVDWLSGQLPEAVGPGGDARPVEGPHPPQLLEPGRGLLGDAVQHGKTRFRRTPTQSAGRGDVDRVPESLLDQAADA